MKSLVMKPQLILGDCLHELKKLSDNSIDLVLTDIPYGEVNRLSGGLRNLDKGAADVAKFELADLVKQLDRVCKGSFYLFCGIEQVSPLKILFASLGYSVRLCIWEKTNPSPMNGTHLWLSSIECCVFAKKPGAFFDESEACSSCVWRAPVVHAQRHPTQKPVELFARLIHASTQEGAVVLDPFMGSGTTGVAAQETLRKFVGIEIEPKWFQLASTRILLTTPSFKFS